MATVLYLTTNGTSGSPYEPGDLAAEGGSVAVTAETLISLREEGPFEPLARAVRKSGPLRDALARAIAIPSLRHYARIRLSLLAIVTPPIAMLIVLDRDLVLGGHADTGRLGVDLVLGIVVAYELSRRTPRKPRFSAIALVAIALRFCVVAARHCGRQVSPLLYASAALAFVAACVLSSYVPTSSRIALELLGKLGVSRSALLRANEREVPPTALVAASVACAAGLPAIMHLARISGAGLFAQTVVVVIVAAAAPDAARRLFEPRRPPFSSGERHRPRDIALATAIGLALTAGVVTTGHLLFDTGAELARCVERLDAEARLARVAEAAELTRAVAQVRASLPLVVMTCVVFPFVEERVYRGLLQDVLVRKYGTVYGVVAAALSFGVAHLGIYQIALYQTVLIGIGFGVAFAEGGIVAAFVVHAIWNLLQLT